MARDIIYWPFDKFDFHENIFGHACHWKRIDDRSLQPGPFGPEDSAIERYGRTQTSTVHYPVSLLIRRFTAILWMFVSRAASSPSSFSVCIIQIRAFGTFLMILAATLRGIGSHANATLDLYEGRKKDLSHRLELNTWFRVVFSYEASQGVFTIQIDDRPKEALSVKLPERSRWYFFFGIQGFLCKYHLSKFLFINDSLSEAEVQEFKSWVDGRIFKKETMRLPVGQMLDPVVVKSALECSNLCFVFQICRSFSVAKNVTGHFCTIIKLNRRQAMRISVKGSTKDQLKEIEVYFTKIFSSPPWIS
ncbi:uncharacterized protein LOC135486965 [Lineus longissimus]|uniref:uncharacterized protein LOC135486965 n=1 Tax=Lineus longissimus TaxID=88925 RepID=UPI00315D5088